MIPHILSHTMVSITLIHPTFSQCAAWMQQEKTITAKVTDGLAKTTM